MPYAHPRYVGLCRPFLVITSLTGAVISWDYELDEWVNELFDANTAGEPSSLQLAQRVETAYPEIEVTYFELHHEPGHSHFLVEPKINPDTNRLYQPGFNQVYVDPGHIQVQTRMGVSVVRNVYVVLYNRIGLHIPEIAGIDHWGVWFLGIIALIWTFDNFVGFTSHLAAGVDGRGAWLIPLASRLKFATQAPTA